mmetsp:Transcript_65739/g.148338  ORF Transcript_65739/g.148338 Transcript_65739/m.148338 type:complete len:373 (-) Transcript_65739:451-1569(-)
MILVSVDAGDDEVGHELAVLGVVLAVLEGAFLLVALRPVQEQDREENGVEQGGGAVLAWVGEEAPGPGRGELEHVVEVPRDAPEARREEKRLPLLDQPRLRVRHRVGGLDVLGALAPDEAVALALAEGLALGVGPVVEEHAGEAHGEDGPRLGRREARRVQHEEAGVEGVDGGHPAEAAPLDLPPGPVHDDVDAPHVAHLPLEELDQVQELAQTTEGESPVDLAVPLVTRVGETGARQHPIGHGKSAVDKALDVNSEDARVEFSPPCEVLEEGPARSAVLRRGKVQAFIVEEEAQGKPEEAERGHHGRKDVEEAPKAVQAVEAADGAHVREGVEEEREDEAVREGVVHILGHVACQRLRTGLDLAGKTLLEN